ncbi:kinase-like domain-containing protein [Mycena galericulata]|nr:kinase-like domain-containing protein [Mycena galericulata]
MAKFKQSTSPAPRSKKDINFQDLLSPGVARTAPGVIVKCTGQYNDNAEEVRALKFVYNLLSIHTPRVLRHPPFPRYTPSFFERTFKGVWYFYMDECPGVQLSEVVDSMTPAELNTVADQLSAILSEMRACRRKFIGSVSGGPLKSVFLPYPWTPDHPFDSVGEFLEHLHGAFVSSSGQKSVDELFSRLPRNAPIVLTHGDLLPHNILVEGAKITAVINWETAGFYPDFWEYARMQNIGFATPGWSHILARVFPGVRRTAEISAVNDIASFMHMNGC